MCHLSVRFSITPGCCSISAWSSSNVMMSSPSLSAAENRASVRRSRSLSPKDSELSSIQDCRTILNSPRSMAPEPVHRSKLKIKIHFEVLFGSTMYGVWCLLRSIWFDADYLQKPCIQIYLYGIKILQIKQLCFIIIYKNWLIVSCLCHVSAIFQPWKDGSASLRLYVITGQKHVTIPCLVTFIKQAKKRNYVLFNIR